MLVMNSNQKLAQWQIDLNQCCGPVCKPKKHLSRLAKEALEPEPIEDEYQRFFGGRE